MPNKTKRLTLKSLRELTFAQADFIAALPTQPSPVEDKRQTALAAARELGWEG